jgi:uncharacterized membrane protein
VTYPRAFTHLLFATVLLAFAAPDASAEVRVCNKTGQGLNVAFAVFYTRDEVRLYESRGYQVLADRQCADVVSSGYRRVWLYASGQDGSEWEGATKQLPARSFCIKSNAGFFFDDGLVAGLHDSADICAQQGGTLKNFREFFGQSDFYNLDFTRAAAPAGGGRGGGTTKPPSTRPRPIWETYPDDPAPAPSRTKIDRGPKPTFAD